MFKLIFLFIAGLTTFMCGVYLSVDSSPYGIILALIGSILLGWFAITSSDKDKGDFNK